MIILSLIYHLNFLTRDDLNGIKTKIEFFFIRMGVIEETLNDDSSETFPISDIVNEIVRLQFAKRVEADANDCLVAKCEKMFRAETKRLKNNQTQR